MTPSVVRFDAGCHCVKTDRYAVAVSEAPGPFRRWLWSPPRAHGEAIAGRRVSFLELFYDLVYVAVISQAAHHLAEHVTVRGSAEFAVIFALIWIAWVGGSLYLDLHGREDGRTRNAVFVQMAILVLLAVFTADAAGDSGAAFAVVYAIFLAVEMLLYYTVRRQDRWDPGGYQAATGRWVTGLGLGAVVMLASALLPDEPRLSVWAGVAVAFVVGMLLLGRSGLDITQGLPPTESLVERFGLFTIIVLGEVVFGIVEGLSSAEHDAKTITTGMLALWIGFGFWWVYFDFIGRRLPRRDFRAIVPWLLSHLPITMSIAAAGAAMVSLIAHAHDARTPAGTAWLLSGAVALGMLALILTERSLADAERLDPVYRPLRMALAAGAAASLIVGWARPAPWLLALLLVAILSVVWFFGVSRFLRLDAWGEDQTSAQ